jgi:hypothetical protein
MTGIDYPTISVGGHKDLTVRWSLAAQFLMKRRGVDPAGAPQAMQGTTKVPNPDMRTQTDPPFIEIGNKKAVENVVIVFSACVAENFLDTSQPNKVDLNTAPTADYWAVQITDFSEVEKAVWAALGKAVEERRKKLAVVPPLETEAAS